MTAGATDGDVLIFVDPADAGCKNAATLADAAGPPWHGGTLAAARTAVQLPGVPVGSDASYELCKAEAATPTTFSHMPATTVMITHFPPSPPPSPPPSTPPPTPPPRRRR